MRVKVGDRTIDVPPPRTESKQMNLTKEQAEKLSALLLATKDFDAGVLAMLIDNRAPFVVFVEK
jgi:hypothetical protein